MADDTTTVFPDGDGGRTRPKPKRSRDEAQPIRVSVPIAESVTIPVVEAFRIDNGLEDLIPLDIPKSPDAPLPKIEPITLNANPQVTVDQFVVLLNLMEVAINKLQAQVDVIIAEQAEIIKQINRMNARSKTITTSQVLTLKQQLAQQNAVIAQQRSMLSTIRRMNAS